MGACSQSISTRQQILMRLATGVFVLVYMPPDYPLERFGVANSVTLLRGALVSWLAGFKGLPELITDIHLAWSLLTTAFIVLLLDGLDGWLAHKTGQTSAFGAKFDMEVDSLFAIVLPFSCGNPIKSEGGCFCPDYPDPCLLSRLGLSRKRNRASNQTKDRSWL
jgi:hypothetical protein